MKTVQSATPCSSSPIDILDRAILATWRVYRLEAEYIMDNYDFDKWFMDFVWYMYEMLSDEAASRARELECK